MDIENMKQITGKRYPAWVDAYPKSEWCGVAVFFSDENAWMAAATLYDGDKEVERYFIPQEHPRIRYSGWIEALEVGNAIAEALSDNDMGHRSGAW